MRQQVASFWTAVNLQRHSMSRNHCASAHKWNFSLFSLLNITDEKFVLASPTENQSARAVFSISGSVLLWYLHLLQLTRDEVFHVKSESNWTPSIVNKFSVFYLSHKTISVRRNIVPTLFITFIFRTQYKILSDCSICDDASLLFPEQRLVRYYIWTA